MARFGLPLSDSESDSERSEAVSDVTGSEDERESSEAPPQSWIDNSDDDDSYELDEGVSGSQSGSEAATSAQSTPPRAVVTRETPSRPLAPLRQGDNLASPWPKKLKLEPKRVAVMQASFFHQADTAVTDAAAKTAKGKQRAPAELDWRPVRDEEFVDGEPEQRAPAPIRYKKLRKYERVPLAQSVTNSHEHVFTQSTLLSSRSFKPGWGPAGTVVHVAPLYGQQQPTRSDALLVTKLRTAAAPADKRNSAALKLLETQLKLSTVDFDDDTPAASALEEMRFHHFVSLLENDRSSEAQAFRLASALFDEVRDLDIPQSFTAPQATYATEIRRNLAVQDWLANAVSATVEEELRKVPARTAGAAARRVFCLLTGHQITRAANAAIDENDLRLATLVAQAGGDDAFREDIFLQLAKWREYRADAHIDADYRKVYELLSGNVGFSEGVAQGDKVDGAPDLHVSEGLDWKRAFGLHLWYGSHNASLKGAIERYEKASQNDKRVAPPLPAYLERPEEANESTKWKASRQSAARDPLFQLLKLYTDRTFSLEDLLLPQNFSSSPLDYRLSWHLYILLSRVLRVRDVEDRLNLDEDDAMDGVREGNSVRADTITEAYASQLEQDGLWEWAVFVLLHLELVERREKAIRELLCRNVDSMTDESFEFLTTDLKIPSSWIFAAQALEAKYDNALFDQYKLLVQAQDQKAAHDIAAFDLAPETIIRNDFDLLRRLFEPFNGAQIPTWDQGGQIYLDYADCVDAFARGRPSRSQSAAGLLKRCVRNVGGLEKARPDSLKLRLAVSEMKRRLALLAATQQVEDDVKSSLQATKADQLVTLETVNSTALANALQAAGAA